MAPDAYQPGDAETQVIAEILAAEKSGRIHRRLVFDEQLAVDVSAEVEPLCLGSVCSLEILAMPDADLDRIEGIVDEELSRLWSEGASEEEVSRACAAIERETLTHMEDLLWRADKLNEYQFHLGEPDSFQADLERFRSLTPAALALRRVLAPGERVIVRVLPEEPERAPSARDRRPDDLPQADFAPPAPEDFALENGIPVTLFSRHDPPRVEVALLIEAGADRVADAPGQEGAAELLASMLSEGAGDRDAPAFAAALQGLGAEFEASATRGGIAASLSTLRRSFAPALALLADAVLRPRLAEDDWLRVKDLHLEELKQQEDIPEAVAARVARRLLFGAEHQSGRPLDGTAASVSGIELEDVAALRRALFHPTRARLVVAGDLTAADARTLLNEAFGSWTAAEEPAGSPALSVAPQSNALRVYLVDRPRAVQTVIHFALPGIARSDARRVPYELIGTVLGGTFTSRLNSNLREDKGFTYGAAAAHAMEKRCGMFAAFSS
ncbi:MAG: insulinase family protein, partial [Planctomycetes bacterium]|nr:insulinase family protein [Planctomycetota bacterium]